MSREFDPNLSAWLDGEVSPADAPRIRRQLDSDAAAQQQLAELRLVHAVVGRARGVDVSKADAARLLAQVSARLPQARVTVLSRWTRRSVVTAIVSLAAAVVVAVGLSVAILNSSNSVPATPLTVPDVVTKLNSNAPRGNQGGTPASGVRQNANSAPEVVAKDPVSPHSPMAPTAPTAPTAPASPSDDMLLALDLLASDVSVEAVAALDDRDVSILGDMTYHDVLADYDRRK